MKTLTTEFVSEEAIEQQDGPDKQSTTGPNNALLLAQELRESITGEVRFDAGSKALYSTDSSNYRQIPIGVVIPRTREDVFNTIRIFSRHGAPITGRGGGTSLAGQCCNAAVVIDFSKYLHRLIELDPEKKTARVEPGIVYDTVNHAAAAHGLASRPDPSTLIRTARLVA